MSFTALDKHRLRLVTYLGGFFLNVAVAVAAYINSSFIEQFVGEKSVGLIYIIIAGASIIISFNTDGLTKRVGNRWALIVLLVGNLLAIAGLVAYRHTAVVVPFFIIYSVISFLVAINLDLYLEGISDDRITGKIRGVFLTLINLAWLASPLLAGWLIASQGYTAVYFVSGLAFLPLLFLVIRYFQDVPRENYERFGIYPTLKRLWRSREGADLDLRHVLELDFLLNLFYAVMIIYLPIYLHNHIGLSWESLGLTFTIMLLPFVLLDFVLGWLADGWLGEKELLITGLVITAFATLLIPLLSSPNLILWAAILFLTRVGAATLEMMKETYLFKQISGHDIDIIFISRNTSPLAYIIAALLATLWLAFFPYQYLFALVGFIVLLGLPSAIALRDTK